MTKPLEYMVLQKIRKGDRVGVNPNLGGVVPARLSDIPIGYAARDIEPGEIIKVVLNGNTDDVITTGEAKK